MSSGVQLCGVELSRRTPSGNGSDDRLPLAPVSPLAGDSVCTLGGGGGGVPLGGVGLPSSVCVKPPVG